VHVASNGYEQFPDWQTQTRDGRREGGHSKPRDYPGSLPLEVQSTAARDDCRTSDGRPIVFLAIDFDPLAKG
jgi:hypothetical protein